MARRVRLSDEERRERILASKRRYNVKMRAIMRQVVIEKYGSECACCGEREPIFLCIDHINGGGGEERKLLGGGKGVLKKLYDAPGRLPGYRILCANCNHALNVTNKIYGVSYCPHHTLDFEDTGESHDDFEWGD